MRDFLRYTWKGALFLLRLCGRALRVLVALLLILGIALFFAARHVFDEDRVRSFMSAQLQELLQRPVQLGEVVLTPSGVKVRDIRVVERLDVPGQHLLTSEMAVVTVRPMALLERRLELGSVRLINPRLQLLRDVDGRWNVADIFTSSGPRRTPGGGLLPLDSMNAQLVVMEGGEVRVEDRLKTTRYVFRQVNLEVERFDTGEPFAFKATFTNESTLAVSTKPVVSSWEVAGEMSLANYDWTRAFARATKISGRLDGQAFTAKGSITAFLGSLVELDVSLPAIPAEAWPRYMGKPLDLSLPPSRWSLKLAFPNPRQIELRQVHATGGGFTATASGLLDLSGEPSLTAEVRADGVPLERLAELRSSLKRFELKGAGEGRGVVAGPLKKLVLKEGEASVKGFGGLFGRFKVTTGDVSFKTSEEFARIAVSAVGGIVEAYGFPFREIKLASTLVKGDLKVDELAFKWTGAKIGLKARVANVTAPKEVVIAGQADNVDWADAQQLVQNFIEENRKDRQRPGEPPQEWVRVFKYVIPKRFPDMVGEVTVAQVRHRNFYFNNMDLLWEVRNITKELNRTTGDVKIGFGPGRVHDVAAVQASHKFLRIVFLPFEYMYKMNNLAVFSAANLYPKSLDFTRIEGEYHVEKGAADTRCFFVDSPEVVAYSEGVADFARERVEMNILTRLTKARGGLPEWWVDELGRPAIGFRVKNDLNKPDLDPRLREMEKNEIEDAVTQCKAKSKMRSGALEKIRRL